MKTVIYARVSSREQEKEGFSIPAQIKLLEEYARRHNMTIVQTYSEAETAKCSGREEFTRMLDYLKQSKDVRTILVEKTDRLYRNFKDYVRLEELDVEIHFVKEGEILSKDSRSHVKFIHGIKVLMAKNYIDNLSEEVKKGLIEKAEQGHWPLAAPYGYRNNRETRLLDPNPAQFELVQRAFALYGSGLYSLSQVREALYEEGFIFRPSQPKIGKSTLDQMLKNIFYTGDFIFRGKFYKGKHMPAVSLDEFQQVQDIFQQVARPKMTKHQFAFAGLLTCGLCGCTITPQIQKKRYVYYHCSNGKGKCQGKYIREEAIADQFLEALKKLESAHEYIDRIIPVLKSHHQEEIEFHNRRVSELQERYNQLTKRIELIYEDKLDEKIPEELWFRKHEEYKREQARINEWLRQHEKGNYDYVESGVELLNLAKDAFGLYSRRSEMDRRRILTVVLSNCTLTAGKVGYTYKIPFNLIVDRPDFEKVSG